MIRLHPLSALLGAAIVGLCLLTMSQMRVAAAVIGVEYLLPLLLPPAARTVSNVISNSKSTCASTITRICFTRPALSAFSHAPATSLGPFKRLCPLPDEDITGLTKHG